MARPGRTSSPGARLQSIVVYDGVLLGLDQQGQTWCGRFEPHKALNQFNVEAEEPFSLEWYLIPQGFFAYTAPEA